MYNPCAEGTKQPPLEVALYQPPEDPQQQSEIQPFRSSTINGVAVVVAFLLAWFALMYLTFSGDL